MAKPTPAQANKLIDLYVSLYENKYDQRPMLNRHKDKWAFLDMITDIGQAQAVEVIEYYFSTTRPGHPLKYLLFNYDKLNRILNEIKEDEVQRAKIMQETKRRVEEWENDQRS